MTAFFLISLPLRRRLDCKIVQSDLGHLWHFSLGFIQIQSIEILSNEIFMYPFNEVGVYCFANVGRSVGPSVGLSVGRPYLVWVITRHRIDLGLSNLAQTCVSGCR